MDFKRAMIHAANGGNVYQLPETTEEQEVIGLSDTMTVDLTDGLIWNGVSLPVRVTAEMIHGTNWAVYETWQETDEKRALEFLDNGGKVETKANPNEPWLAVSSKRGIYYGASETEDVGLFITKDRKWRIWS